MVILYYKTPTHHRYLISGVSAINPLAAFYDIHGKKGEGNSFVLTRTPLSYMDVIKGEG
jgi:hypothetical protein